MGEIADMMLDGTLCEGCGVYMGDDCGYSRRCAGCRKQDKLVTAPKEKVKHEFLTCPECKKRVKKVGILDHRRDKHGVR